MKHTIGSILFFIVRILNYFILIVLVIALFKCEISFLPMNLFSSAMIVLIVIVFGYISTHKKGVYTKTMFVGCSFLLVFYLVLLGHYFANSINIIMEDFEKQKMVRELFTGMFLILSNVILIVNVLMAPVLHKSKGEL